MAAHAPRSLFPVVALFASIVALILGLMLPGWPRAWGGRRAADVPTVGH